MQSDNALHLLNLATDQHRAGNLAEARRLYQQCLAQLPDLPLAQFRLGLLEMQEGRLEQSLALIQRAAAIDTAELKYQIGLGQLLSAMARWPEAAAAYRIAAGIDPASVDASFGFACAVHSSNDIHSAEQAYRHVLTLDANHAGAMSNLAGILQARGEPAAAIDLLKRAIDLEPASSAHVVNLAAALCASRRFTEAETILRPVITNEPGNADAIYNLANALQGQGKLIAARQAYQAAVTQRPGFADAWNNLGTLCKASGNYRSAEGAYRSAIAARPGFISAINNLGCLLRTIGRLEESETVFRDGLQVDPNSAALHENLGNVLKDTGRLEEAIARYRQALQLDPANPATHSNLVYSLSFCETDPAKILEEARRWNHLHAKSKNIAVTRASGPCLLPSNLKDPADAKSPARAGGPCHHETKLESRLRIGYVSPDFREHCQSLFTIPLLSNHDHAAFEIVCYSSAERPDAVTARIARYADVWREVRHLDDAALGRQIREDRIDILVDLTMHMADGRPGVFALKPTPIQIAWLAYPGTTGMDAMDYRLSDPRLDPPGFESHYAEQTIRLPDAFWCYDPLTTEPPVSDLPALSNGYITFGCLNNPCKLTDHTIRLWAEVMKALPTSRLMLLMSEGSHRRFLVDRLARAGISADRVELANYEPRSKYLQRYQQIDLGLDTFPYNGHTTSLDSFWMGVPVITRIGPTCVGRAGLCQLYQLGMPELAAETDSAFVDVAVNLANDLPRLTELRRTLRGRMEGSQLMDGPRFAKNMEAVFRRVEPGGAA